MADYCVLAADRGRARFFTLDTMEPDEQTGGPDLVEKADFTNPEKRLPQTERFTESKPGAGRETESGAIHGYDDHRDQYEAETDRKFARAVIERMAKMAAERNCPRIIIAAPSRMLGLLREYEDVLTRTNAAVQVISKDISKLSPQQIHEHLAKEDLLPPRRKPSFV